MLSRLPKFLVALALAGSIGLHLAVFQSVAWVGMVISYSQQAFNGKPITTGTNASYSIARVQTVQAGTYSVAVTSPYGSVASDSATLAINAGSGVFAVVGAPFSYQTPTTINATHYRASAMPRVCTSTSTLAQSPARPDALASTRLPS